MQAQSPSSRLVRRVNVLGVGISSINMPMAKRLIGEALRQGTRGYICVTGVHGVMEAQRNPSLRAIINRALLCTPDGMPMVWTGRLSGHPEIERVYGPDLMLEVCAMPGIRHFLFGGSDPETTALLKRKLEERFPGIQIVGTFTPPWRPLNEAEAASLKAQLEQCKADVFWVGLSTPKQEMFMDEYINRLPVTLMFGVGAAFDMHSGLLPQAPRWMQRSGLEWVYRLIREPRRLWRRYLRNNPAFLVRIIAQLLKLRRYSLDQ